MTAALLWTTVILLALIGIAGSVLPAIPGSPLIFAALLLGAWIDDFTKVGALPILFLGILTVLTLVVDVAAAALGAKRVKASPLAVTGAAIGTVLGIFFGLIGVLFLPFIGAAVGQFIAEPDLFRAGKVGVATWIGFICGVVIKVAIAFVMLGIFLVAYLWK